MATAGILETCYTLFFLSTFHRNQDLCLVFDVADKNSAANSNLILVSTDLFPSPTVVTRRLAILRLSKKPQLYLSNH